MRETPPSTDCEVVQRKSVSIQERSVHVGDFIVVNGHNIKHATLKQRFAEGGYTCHETKHFLLFTRAEEPKTILVHWFVPEEITTNIPGYLTDELKPFGLIKNNQRLGELFAGIVGGTVFPDDVRRAWNYFGANTLQRLCSHYFYDTLTRAERYGSCCCISVRKVIILLSYWKRPRMSSLI